jgi:hypothetical protein
MALITPAEARAYLERWALVEEFEIAERRAASMETKLQQLSALMASRDIFAEDPEREKKDRTIRTRDKIRDRRKNRCSNTTVRTLFGESVAALGGRR